MNILFNKEGMPLAMSGETVFGSTITKKVLEKLDDTFFFDDVEYASWGGNNCYPDEAESVIENTSVLKTGLNYKVRCCYGQGVVPVQVVGFDEQGNEVLQPLNDANLLSFLRGLTFRNYHTSAFRDLIKFGNCFPLLVFDNAGKNIVRVDTLNARHCRISIDKTKLLVFGDFKNGTPTKEKSIVYDMLSEQDPVFDLQWRRDLTEECRMRIADKFQSTRPRGARRSAHTNYNATSSFQSTRPRGARLGALNGIFV